MSALNMFVALQANGSSAADQAEAATKEILKKFDNIDFYKILIILFVAIAVSWAIRRTLPWLARYVPTKFRLIVLGISPIVRLIIMLGAIALLIPEILNLNRSNLLVIAGGASVAIGFAFKDLVSSLISGMVAVFERPYRPGDWVTVGDHYGEILSIGLRSFRLRTPSDDVVTVAHDRMWEDDIVNSNDGADTLMCVVHMFVRPDHDPVAVRRGLVEVALTSPYLAYRKPTVVQLVQKPHATEYKIKAYPFDMRDQFAFVSDLTARGKLLLKDMGVEEATSPYVPDAEG